MATLNSTAPLQSTCLSLERESRKVLADCPPASDLRSESERFTPFSAIRPRQKKRSIQVSNEETVADITPLRYRESSSICTITNVSKEKDKSEETEAVQRPVKQRRRRLAPLADPETETRHRERLRYDAQLAQAADPLIEAEVDRRAQNDAGIFMSFTEFFRHHASKKIVEDRRISKTKRKKFVAVNRGGRVSCHMSGEDGDCKNLASKDGFCDFHYNQNYYQSKKGGAVHEKA